jgi:hypothetical protein
LQVDAYMYILSSSTVHHVAADVYSFHRPYRALYVSSAMI